MDTLSPNRFGSLTFDSCSVRVTAIEGVKHSKGKTNEYHTFNDLNHFIKLDLRQCQDLNISIFMWGHPMGGFFFICSCHSKFKSNISSYITYLLY